MAHIKIVTNGDYRASAGARVATMLKFSSRGLIGNDRAEFLKFASHDLLPLIDSGALKPGDVPIHEIALGVWENVGSNRNGDCFKEAECRKNHHTFVKFARSYRDHKNKQPEKSYGYVKASCYNEVMRRIELLTILNGTKEAAERNGGLIADLELQKLAKGEDLPRSMACRVPYDVCTACGNRARNRTEYCESKEAGGTCTRLGCKNNLTKMAHDGYMQSVFNPDCVWFDMSKVTRPADPTAYAVIADWLTKAAESESGIGGAQLAEHLGVIAPLSVVCYSEMPVGTWQQFVSEQVKLAHVLSVIEDRITRGEIPVSHFRGVSLIAQNPVNMIPLGEVGSQKMAAGLGALAREMAILPLAAFAQLTGQQHTAKAASLAMPGIYSRMLAAGTLQSQVENNRFAPGWALPPTTLRVWAKTAGCSLQPARMEEEAIRARIRQLPLPELAIRANGKQAFAKEAQVLAADYAIYKLSALHRMLEVESQFLPVAVAAVGLDYLPVG